MTREQIQKSPWRPWPAPRRSWRMAMRWEDLLFLHWAVERGALAPLLPAGLELDVREGQAWLGVVPFRMSGVRTRGLPAVPGTDAFPELNVRTYVRHGDRPGVWFFSLDAANPLAVWAARRFFHLNYLHASMQCVEKEGGWVHYASERTHREALPAVFLGCYRSAGPVFAAPPGSLEHWLAERYCLYAADGEGRVFRGEIHHLPWSLQRAEVRIETNTMAGGLGVDLSGTPHALYARSIEVVAWGIEQVGKEDRP